MKLIDACFRCAYRLVYPVARLWWHWHGHRSTAIIVWFDGRVLAVRHSYKPGLRLPGGGVKSREDHRTAAIRELREETGVIVAPADAVEILRSPGPGKYGIQTLFEVHLDAEPVLTVDNREIVYAGFAPLKVIEQRLRDRYGAVVLTAATLTRTR